MKITSRTIGALIGALADAGIDKTVKVGDEEVSFLRIAQVALATTPPKKKKPSPRKRGSPQVDRR